MANVAKRHREALANVAKGHGEIWLRNNKKCVLRNTETLLRSIEKRGGGAL